MINVQNGKEVNVYIELERDLKENILSNNIKYDKPILGELELAEKYNISRKSVRKALQNLTNQGLIKKIQGRGTFIIPPWERVRMPSGMFMKILFISPKYGTFGTSFELDHMLFDGAAEACVRGGHKIVFSNTDIREKEVLEKYESGTISGVIWNRPELCSYGEKIAFLKRWKVPQVLINRKFDGVCSIMSDSYKALDDCVRFLNSIGHSQIAFFNRDSREDVFTEREKAYFTSMKSLDLEKSVSYFQTSDDTFFISSLEKIFDGKKRITSLILGGIAFIIPFLLWKSGVNIRIPEDLSVICIDDSNTAKSNIPPISVYAEAKNDIGRRAVAFLENIIKNKVIPGEEIKITGDLIQRRSCASPGEKSGD